MFMFIEMLPNMIIKIWSLMLLSLLYIFKLLD